MQDLSRSGMNSAHYFLYGWRLISQPGLRLFVIIPLLVNTLLFAGAFYWLYARLQIWITEFEQWLPNGLHWLQWLLWPLAILTIIVVFSFIFASIGNWIAAPFNGLLSERTELLLTGQPLPDGQLKELVTDLPRVFAREWQKLCYWLPRVLILSLAFFIPGIGQSVIPVLWFVFSAWMMAIQYIDYPFDNHKISFRVMRKQLSQHRSQNWGFGALVTIATGIPLVNWVVMPAAICGATALWVDHYRSLNLDVYEKIDQTQR
ncbi:CysZ protein [Celerinatantimonas diazotrophica]|uniref:Sulfate transporter CysZ n=2 Tax=Celerinatantimonas diazotrophica TaxID=412034 RepID=A0A4R1K722_9GAMM|nr:CysZ protein [Celerinatantimonas diazotrophica]CAG9297481.1 Sulfate transporter CysZ [Celerinatantimonas diazotrophica]